MKTKQLLLAIGVGISFILSINFLTWASGETISTSLRALAENAISNDASIASPAIRQLREQGPEGLLALLNVHSALIQLHEKSAMAPLDSQPLQAWERLRTALDAVSGQRDDCASRLFWHTDFNEAKKAAQASGKPILSLRLLGKLNEEYSCANSRFFRTTLYANAEVSQYLRDHFILHWQSVRPVPRITIDFGDGRKIERTITGNSIHYILDAHGRPIDALPGLYSPQAFLKGLEEAEAAELEFAKLAKSPIANQAENYLRQYHNQRLAAIQQAWSDDMAALGTNGVFFADYGRNVGDISRPAALSAADRAKSKSYVERPMLKSFQTADDDTWLRVANLHAQDAALDAASVNLIRSKNPTALEAARVAYAKSVVENPLASMLRNLQRSIAEDTVRNEYLLHSQIHEWYIQGIAPHGINELNQAVYARLFLTPDLDPWLGLVPANTFTGLDNNGLAQAKSIR